MIPAPLPQMEWTERYGRVFTSPAGVTGLVCETCGNDSITAEAQDEIDAAVGVMAEKYAAKKLKDFIKLILDGTCLRTQKQVAVKLGVQSTYLSRLLNGKQAPSEALFRLLRTYAGAEEDSDLMPILCRYRKGKIRKWADTQVEWSHDAQSKWTTGKATDRSTLAPVRRRHLRLVDKEAQPPGEDHSDDYQRCGGS